MPPALVPPAGARLLFLHDIRALLPVREDGKPAFTDRWIREHVAPNRSRHVARRWAVSSADFETWHARWVAGKLTPEELPTRQRGGRAGRGERGERGERGGERRAS